MDVNSQNNPYKYIQFVDKQQSSFYDINQYLFPYNTKKQVKYGNGLSIILSSFLGEKGVLQLTQELLEKKEELISLYLNFNSCGIGQLGSIHLNQCFSQMNKITDLEIVIKKDFIKEEGVIQLYKGISNLINMQQLNLQVEQPFSLYFIGLLTHFKNISRSKLRLKYYQNIDFSQHDNTITKIVTQLNLKLEESNFQIEGARGLGQSLSTFTNLQSLSLLLSQNNIQKEGMIAISEGIKVLKQLQTLDIKITQKNKVEDKGFQQLLDCIKNLQNLSQLSLIILDKSISLDAISYLGEELKDLNLISLSLEVNEKNINSADIIKINEGLKKMKQLKKLMINISHQASIIFLTQLQNFQQLQIQISVLQQIYSFKNENNKVQALSLKIKCLDQLMLDGLRNVLSEFDQLSDISIDTGEQILEQQIADQFIQFIRQSQSIVKLKIITSFNGLFKGYINLPQLNEFNLTLEGIDSGSFSSQHLCSTVGRLINLEKLRLQINQYKSLSQCPTIDLHFKNLQKLTSLDLDLFYVGKDTIDYLTQNLNQLLNIESAKIKLQNANKNLISCISQYNKLKFICIIIGQYKVKFGAVRNIYKAKRLVLFQ